MRDISELDSLINEVISYATPSHAGARPYFKDGKNSAIEVRFQLIIISQKVTVM